MEESVRYGITTAIVHYMALYRSWSNSSVVTAGKQPVSGPNSCSICVCITMQYKIGSEMQLYRQETVYPLLFYIQFPIYAWDYNFRSSFQNHTEGEGKNPASTDLSYVVFTLSASPGAEKFVRECSVLVLPALVVIFSVYVCVHLYSRRRHKRNVPTFLLYLELSFLPGSSYPVALSRSSGFSSLVMAKAWASVCWAAWRQRSKPFH